MLRTGRRCELAEGEATARATLARFLESHPDDSFELEANVRSTHALALRLRGDRAGEAAQLLATIDGYEERGMSPRPHLIDLYRGLADAHAALGNAAEAQRFRERGAALEAAEARER